MRICNGNVVADDIVMMQFIANQICGYVTHKCIASYKVNHVKIISEGVT